MNLVLLVLFANPVISGNGSWKSYTNTSFVHDLATDGTSIYLATQGGLCRFSPAEEKYLDTYTNTEGLPVNQCRNLAFDRDTTLWIGTTGGGLAVYSPRTGTFSTIPYNELPESDITALAATGDTILVGSANGLYAILPDRSVLHLTTVHGLPSNTILSVAAGDDFWVGTDRGVSRINSSLVVVASYTAASGLVGDSAMALALGTTPASVFIGTEAGVSRFANGKWDTLVEFSSPWAVRDLVVRQDTLYLATDRGVFRHRPGQALTAVVTSPADVRALLDRSGLWIGFGGNEYAGSGFSRFFRNGAGRDTLVPFPPDCIFSNSVEDVMTDSAGGIWACSGWPPHQQGVSYRDPDGHWHHFNKWPWAGARVCDRDSRNRLWFGCWWLGNQAWSPDSVAGVLRFDPGLDSWKSYNWGSYTPMNVIGALAVDRLDRVLVTSFGPGVVSAIDTNGATIALASSAQLVTARSIAFDSRNRIWIASSGGGLVMVNHNNTLADRSDDTIRIYCSADGLPSLQVFSVAVDGWDRVWFGTDKGLGLFATDRFYLYDRSNTMNGISADHVIRVKTDRWGDVWCLTTAGLSVFHSFENRWTSYLPQNSGIIPRANFVNDYTGLWLDEDQGVVLIGSKNGGLSRFSFRLTPPANLESISVHPNPFVPAAGHQRVIFDRLPADARITIYTLAGERIATLAADPNRHAQAWTPPASIASGLYLAVVSTPSGRRSVKFTVVK